ncbi:hypothetical protein F4553_007227 [Allocatelliglobosispora scoriae]|uniref:Gingipain domain-containing protein n=1 Tax=Allocatelliglobosispora scoriae TaxID=643052 RepID=A0A841C3S8_9ACTN|nr:C25 family cysteine peptidase [Allocatelliglobosispora scoriae]MBB5873793.1 hypothetical protein [Allocatelliglobosispora scoriae]
MSISRHEGNQVDVALTYSPKDVVIKSTPYGALITLDGAAGVGEPGDPALPRAVVRVALPEGAIAVSATAEVIETRQLSKEPVLLAPVQPLRAGIKESLRRTRLGGEREAAPVPAIVLPNLERYARLMAEPRPVARLLAVGDGQAPVATVEINPLALDEAGHLILHEQITVTIGYRLQDEVTRAQKWRDVTQGRFTSATQAADHFNLLRNLVLNPDDVVRVPPWLDEIVVIRNAEYLVITDRHYWNAETITAVASIADGDPVAEFERLAAWKRARGLSARVVTVTDIVGGHYGDFRTGARDLPEVIRNFVKHARRSWGTRWLLLGGDTEIVPTRIADGGFLAEVTPGSANPPAAGGSHWAGTELHINTTGMAIWWGADSENTLIRPDTGLVVPYDPTGTAALGWHFTTDNSYATACGYPTDFVVAKGSAAQLNTTLRFLYHWNKIPTDFYYASLIGTGYGVSGRHDWDFRGNGVYGEHGVADVDDPDVITWQAHVSVGRAPVNGAMQARTFVTKVLTYEQMPQAALPFGPSYERGMVVVGDSWGGRIGVWPATMSALGENQYVHPARADHSVIQLTAAEIPISYHLFAQVADNDLRQIPYDAAVRSGGRGWHYCLSATDVTPSTRTFDFGPGMRFRLPVPSGFIAVYSDRAEELTPTLYILDEPVADGSMLDQEQVVDIARASLHGITTIDRLYTDEVDLPAGRPAGARHLHRASLTEALNKAPHLVSLSGHGSMDGVAYLDGAMASTLSNGLPGFIAYADSCLTGAFEWGEAMSEQLLTNPDGGAVAYIGNSRFSWIGVGDDFQRLFWQRLSTTRNLGLLADSRCELVHTAGLHPTNTKWVVLSLNLLGDPEMPIWTRAPRKVRIPRTIPVIKEWEWPIRDDLRRLVPDAVLTIIAHGQTVNVRADAGGIVRIDTSTLVAPGATVEVEVIVTAPGHAPDRGHVTLVGAAPSSPVSLLAGYADNAYADDQPTSILGIPASQSGIDPANLTRDFRFVAE